MIKIFELIIVGIAFTFFGIILDLTNKYFKNHRDEK